METASTMVENRFKEITKEKLIEWIDFARVFMKAVFKESLL